ERGRDQRRIPRPGAPLGAKPRSADRTLARLRRRRRADRSRRADAVALFEALGPTARFLGAEPSGPGCIGERLSGNARGSGPQGLAPDPEPLVRAAVLGSGLHAADP